MQDNSQTSIEPILARHASSEIREAINNLWDVLGRIAPQLKASGEENRKLKGICVELEKRVISDTDTIAGLKNALDILEKKLEDSDAEVALLNEELENTGDLLRQRGELSVENERLLVQLKEFEEVKKNFALAQKEFVSKNQALHERAEIINGQKSTIAELENKLKELEGSQTRIYQLESINREQYLKLADLKGEIEILEKLNEDEQRKKAEEIAELRDNINKFSDERQSLEKSIEEIKKYNYELKDRLGEQDGMLRSSTENGTALTEELENVNAAIVELQRENRELLKYKETDTVRDKILDDYTGEIDSIKASKEAMEHELIDIRKRYEIAFNELDESKRALKAMDALNMEIEAIREELRAKNLELTDLKDEIYESKTLEPEIEKLRTDLNSLTVTLSNVNLEKNDLLSELNEQKRQNQELQMQYNEFLEQITHMETKVSSQNLPQDSSNQHQLSPEQEENKKLLISRIENYLGKLEKFLN